MVQFVASTLFCYSAEGFNVGTADKTVNNVTHLPSSPPHEQCFCLCPGPTATMKTPRPHFYSGQFSVFQTLNSAKRKYVCIKQMDDDGSPVITLFGIGS